MSRTTRREFVVGSMATSLAALVDPSTATWALGPDPRPIVSIARVKDGKIASAVEQAIDLLGGIESVARGKRRIMLKPNLVSDQTTATTKPVVVATLATLMKKAGKEVSIGEGSAAANGFNVVGPQVYRAKKTSVLNPMQQHVFDVLGYTDLAKRLDVPLVNLHSGDMATVKVPGGLAYPEIRIHRSLTEIELLCSVPMMKTHTLATVTLGMKNLIGLYPGAVYGSVRAGVHDHAADKGSVGIAYEILDMVRANRLGLVVVDGSTAMEGEGPSLGKLVPMDVIIAGTNALATDMVATAAMGIDPKSVPTFAVAHRLGIKPAKLEEIEIRGASLASVRRPFVRPHVTPWNNIRRLWGNEAI